MNVYLAGPVEKTGIKTATAWRGIAKTRLRHRGITCIDPMRTGDCQSDQDGIITTSSLPDSYLMLRCYNDVKNSDLVLANLKEGNYPSHGTVMEMGWAWSEKKPVIAVTSEEQVVYWKHPMISQAITLYLPTLDEALLRIIELLPVTL